MGSQHILDHRQHLFGMLAILASLAQLDDVIKTEGNGAVCMRGIYGKYLWHGGIIQKEMKNPPETFIAGGFLWCNARP